MTSKIMEKVLKLLTSRAANIYMIGIGITLIVGGIVNLLIGNYVVYTIITVLPGNSCGTTGGLSTCTAAQNTTGAAYNATLLSITNNSGTLMTILSVALLISGLYLIFTTIMPTSQQTR